ncbi:TIGR02450 family Trp-rich protein [uncultured Psychrosphaera sp.]|jgi:tryptophan-rich hypothetical protein|uniref:TIGR02450 family Trp-rich protein n=1 Tax=uncultured Psychrosphaera sp. TaxID=1403522 RepID=UPI002633FD6A|nr:TIGR02450 family Trp-rich protein [uncultured Psychrosphaera sp.]
MNRVNPKALLNSKWTAMLVNNKEKHFIVIDVEFDDEQKVSLCVIEAVINNQQYQINWRDLKDPTKWKIGWQ